MTTYGKRLQISAELAKDATHQQVKEIILNQIDDLLDHILITEGSIFNRDFRFKMYLTHEYLLYNMYLTSHKLEE